MQVAISLYDGVKGNRSKQRGCEAAGPGKPEVYSLEYIEGSFGLRTTQIVADCSQQ
jgi:hypothetical protein